jgi:hypothetical protein
MTDYNKLAKECLNKYPNRKINVFINPNYVGSVNQLGEFDDIEPLAKSLEEAKATFTETGDRFGMDWLDVFPVEYTPEELAELEQKHEEWVDSLFADWD